MNARVPGVTFRTARTRAAGARSTIAAAILTIGAALPVEAQDPLVRYWSALEAASSLPELQRVAPPEGIGTQEEVVESLRSVREYELTRRRSTALVTQRRIERVLRSSPDAWAHFAMGVALARGPDVRVVVGDDPDMYVTRRWQSSNATMRAPRELRRALELDPALHPAAHVLGELALDLDASPLIDDALAALSHPSRKADARSLLLRARLLARLNQLEDAALLAESARAAGADPSITRHIRAGALLRKARMHEEGARVYFDGVDLLTAEGAEAYYGAIAAMLTPGELDRWARSDLAARRSFLRRFWDVHAALAGVPVAQRLAEHYIRLARIHKDGRSAPMGAGAAADNVGDVRRYGVSGVPDLLLLRHGDPDRTQRILLCGEEVLEIPLALAPSPAECARTPLGRLRLAMMRDTRLWLLRAQDEAVQGTSYSPPFVSYLALSWDVLQFRGPARGTSVVAAVALEAESAQQLMTDSVLTARVEFALVDTADQRVDRSESLKSYRVGKPASGSWVLLHEQVDTRSTGVQQYRIGVTDTRRANGRIVGDTVGIVDYSSHALALSDLVTAPTDGQPSFTRGTVQLSLAPGRTFHTGESLTLYYEVYGLPSGTAYRTEILIQPQPQGAAETLRRLIPGAPQSLRLAFDDVAREPHEIYGVQEERTVGLGSLLPGTYELHITITDEAGRTATQQRTLYVTPGAP